MHQLPQSVIYDDINKIRYTLGQVSLFICYARKMRLTMGWLLNEYQKFWTYMAGFSLLCHQLIPYYIFSLYLIFLCHKQTLFLLGAMSWTWHGCVALCFPGCNFICCLNWGFSEYASFWRCVPHLHLLV